VSFVPTRQHRSDIHHREVICTDVVQPIYRNHRSNLPHHNWRLLQGSILTITYLDIAHFQKLYTWCFDGVKTIIRFLQLILHNPSVWWMERKAYWIAVLNNEQRQHPTTCIASWSWWSLQPDVCATPYVLVSKRYRGCSIVQVRSQNATRPNQNVNEYDSVNDVAILGVWRAF
jgi:hypothetical protein